MKNLAGSIIVAFALCMAAAVAQTATDPSQGTQGSSPGMSQHAHPATTWSATAGLRPARNCHRSDRSNE